MRGSPPARLSPQSLIWDEAQARAEFDAALRAHLAGKAAGMTAFQPYTLVPGSHPWTLRTEWVRGETPRAWVIASQLPYPSPGAATPGSFIAATVAVATGDPERPVRAVPVVKTPVDLPTADPRYRAVFPMLEDLVEMMQQHLDVQFEALTADWVQDVTAVWSLVQVMSFRELAEADAAAPFYSSYVPGPTTVRRRMHKIRGSLVQQELERTGTISPRIPSWGHYRRSEKPQAATTTPYIPVTSSGLQHGGGGGAGDDDGGVGAPRPDEPLIELVYRVRGGRGIRCRTAAADLCHKYILYLYLCLQQ